MRRLGLPLAILAAVVAAAALAWLTLTRTGGGGETTTEVRTVEPFHRLEISGRADVTLVEGDRESVTVETGARGQSRVLVHVEEGTLVISAGVSRRWWSGLLGGRRATATPRINIAFKSLDAIALSGSVQIAADKIHTDDLRIAANGGSVEYYGDPEVEESLSGIGRVKRRTSAGALSPALAIDGPHWMLALGSASRASALNSRRNPVAESRSA